MKTALRILALLLAVIAAPDRGGLSAQPTREQIRAFRQANETRIVDELASLLALPNLATNPADIHKNAELLIAMLEQRGIAARKLELPNAAPAVYGELLVPGATKTVVFYAHFDGQPVDSSRWASPAWSPLLRDAPLERGGKPIPLRSSSGRYDPEARLYARSASDDKSPIVAMLWALDALRATKSNPSVNLKFFLEGEEEAGSPHLREMLSRYRSLLAADLWIMGDGPIHQSRAQQIVFGARGDVGVNLTVYGPSRPLHSGHYGNWAPNPNVELIHLLASMRAEDGRITIDGYYDDVTPISPSEREAISAVPPVEAQLLGELHLGRTEGRPDATLLEQISLPALNVSGLSGGLTGPGSANLIVPRATAFLDLRLVPDQTLAGVRRLIERHITRQSFYVVTEEPDSTTLRSHPKVIRLSWGSGYPAAKTALDSPVARAVIRAADQSMGKPLLRVPMLGGSLPLYLLGETLGSPFVLLPIVNHDNNQHGENENLRLANLWDGIELYAGVLARLGSTWAPQP